MQTLPAELVTATNKHTVVPPACSLTEQQIENLWIAYDIMLRAPPHKVNLEYYRIVQLDDDEHCFVSNEELVSGCGTSGCIAGWLTTNQHFIEQGLVFRNSSVEFHCCHAPVDASETLFGYSAMFASGFSGQKGKLQALDRIRAVMQTHSVITSEQNRAMQESEAMA